MRGTDGDDVICGGLGNDEILGLGGDDRLFGDGGNDVIDGGGGNDLLFGDAGDDILRGGDGDDEVSGAGGADTLSGGEGTDVLRGDSGVDDVRGGPGNDEVLGGAGNDFVGGNDGDDFVIGDGGSDTADGGEGVDVCRAETESGCEYEQFPPAGLPEEAQGAPYRPMVSVPSEFSRVAPFVADRVPNVARVSQESVAPTVRELLNPVGASMVDVGAGVIEAGWSSTNPRGPAASIQDSRVDFEVLEEKAAAAAAAAAAAGFDKVVVRVEPDVSVLEAAVAGDGELSVGIDYSAFRWAYGGLWDERLQLYWMEPCWVDATTAGVKPDPSCPAPLPLESVNNVGSGRISATLPAQVLAKTGGLVDTVVPSGAETEEEEPGGAPPPASDPVVAEPDPVDSTGDGTIESTPQQPSVDDAPDATSGDGVDVSPGTEAAGSGTGAIGGGIDATACGSITSSGKPTGVFSVTTSGVPGEGGGFAVFIASSHVLYADNGGLYTTLDRAFAQLSVGQAPASFCRGGSFNSSQAGNMGFNQVSSC